MSMTICSSMMIFNTALADLQSIIRSEKLRLDRQTLRHGDLISKIIGRLR